MSGRRVTSLAVAYAVLGVLPLFLVSAQSVQLQRDLDFDRAGLGLAVSLCFAASALAANPAGRLVDGAAVLALATAAALAARQASRPVAS